MFLIGSRANYNVAGMKSTDWIGHRAGRLVIVDFIGLRRFHGGGKATTFRFRCDCGREFEAQKSNIVGRRTHCGCEDPVKTRTAPPGAWSHPLYKIWTGMISRCENPTNKSFKDYGARGIKVCDRWKMGDGGLTGLECFAADLGPRPVDFTIERVIGDRNYEPGNCVWLAKGDQSKNRRTVRLVRIDGVTHTIPEWCAITGVDYWTAIRRISRGWPPDRAVTKEARRAA